MVLAYVMMITHVMVLSHVMMLPPVMVLACVMKLPPVMVLAHVMMLPCVMVLAPDDYGGHQRETQGLSARRASKAKSRRPEGPKAGPGRGVMNRYQFEQIIKIGIFLNQTWYFCFAYCMLEIP